MQLEVLIEIPKGSRNRYEFDAERKRIRFDRMLPSSLRYPEDCGLIPETLAEDGNALDALVIVQESTFPGCLIGVRAIGLLKTRTGEIPDYKILCVPIDDPSQNEIERLEQVPPELLKEIERFFSFYKEVEESEIEIEGWEGRDQADQIVEEAKRRYRGEREGSEETANAAACHVVIVDGDSHTRQTLVELVSDEGYRVSDVSGGREALDTLKSGPVDLVITELFTGDVGGWELLEEIKQQYPETLVAVTTGNITEEGEAMLENRNVDGYLVKPFHQRPLQILLRALLAPGNLGRTANAVALSESGDLLELIDKTLAERGVSVRTYSNMNKAWTAIWESPPDLVLVDVESEKENGFKLCERIRSSLQLPPLPILLLANHTSPRNVHRSVQLRVNGMLLMPFSPDDLTQRAFKLVGRGNS